MGLISRIQKIRQQEKEMRILILGLDNSGKTTIIKKFNGEDTSQIPPTLGFQIQTFNFQGYKLCFWDIGGQESIRTYWRNFFEKTDGIIWVIDSSDLVRLQRCKNELHELLKQEKLEGATLLLCYNKSDLQGSLSLEEVQQFLELDNIKSRYWAILPTSGYTGQGLYQGIHWIVNVISQRIFS